MTTEEIQALIDAKIAGQGSAVDVGGALPTILKEIVAAVNANTKAISEIPAPVPQVQSDWAQDDDEEVDFIKNKPTIPVVQLGEDDTYESVTLTEAEFNSILSSAVIKNNEGTNMLIMTDIVSNEGWRAELSDYQGQIEEIYAVYGGNVIYSGSGSWMYGNFIIIAKQTRLPYTAIALNSVQ